MEEYVFNKAIEAGFIMCLLLGFSINVEKKCFVTEKHKLESNELVLVKAFFQNVDTKVLVHSVHFVPALWC